MKRLGKILAILFTVAALIGVIAVVASAEDAQTGVVITGGTYDGERYDTLYEAFQKANSDTSTETVTMTLYSDQYLYAVNEDGSLATYVDKNGKTQAVDPYRALKATRTAGPLVIDLNGYTVDATHTKYLEGGTIRNADGVQVGESGRRYTAYNANGEWMWYKGEDGSWYYPNDVKWDPNDTAVRPAMAKRGAISVDAANVSLTINGNGGSFTHSGTESYLFYVAQTANGSHFYINDVEADYNAGNYGVILYAHNGETVVDNCKWTVRKEAAFAIRQGGNARIIVKNSLIETTTVNSNHYPLVRVNDTATSDTNLVRFENCSLITCGNLVAGFDTAYIDKYTNSYKAVGGVTYYADYELRVTKRADGSAGPEYVNTNVEFVDCSIEQMDNHAASNALISTLVNGSLNVDFVIEGCDVKAAWRGFIINGGSLTMTDSTMELTYLGDTRGVSSSYKPLFISRTEGDATVTVNGSTFIRPANIKIGSTTYTAYDVLEHIDAGENNKVVVENLWYDDYDSATVTTSTVNTPIIAMNKTKDGKLSAAAQKLTSRPGTSVILHSVDYGAMLIQGKSGIAERADGDSYVYLDPSYVYNPYDVNGTVEPDKDSQTGDYILYWVKKSGNAYVQSSEGEDGAIQVKGWNVNPTSQTDLTDKDDIPDYIDTNGDGKADYVDLDRVGVSFGGSTASGTVDWECAIPEKYERFYQNQQGYLGGKNFEGESNLLKNVSYAVLDFDYSAGPDATGFLTFCPVIEARGKNASGSDGQRNNSSVFKISTDGAVTGTTSYGVVLDDPTDWYHITIILKPTLNSSGNYKDSIAMLFVDGVLAAEGKMLTDLSTYLAAGRWSSNNDLTSAINGMFCFDNVSVQYYSLSDDTDALDDVFERKVDNLYSWNDSHSGSSVRNDDNIVSISGFTQKNVFDYYANAKAALDAAKYGDVVTLAQDVIGYKVKAPITVKTNGYAFIFNSNKFTATYSEDGQTVTFKTAKPGEITKNEIVVTVDGVEHNLGKLALGSYPFSDNFEGYQLGFDKNTAIETVAPTIDGAAAAYITDVNAKSEYTNESAFVQHEYIMFNKDGGVLEYGKYDDLTTKSTFDKGEKLKNGTNLHLADGTVVRLYADVTSGKTLSFNYKPGAAADVTNYLDLNGYTITYTGTGYAVQAYRHTATIYNASGAPTKGGSKGITAIVYTSQEGGEIYCEDQANAVPVYGYGTSKSTVAVDGATTTVESPVGNAVMYVGNSYANTVMGDDYANYTVSLSGKYLAKTNTYVGYVYFDNVYGESYTYAFYADAGNYTVNNSTVVGKGANMIHSANGLCLLRVDNTVFYSAYENNWGNLFGAIGADGTVAGRYVYFTNCSFVNMGLAGTSIFTKTSNSVEYECYNKDNVAFGPGCKFTNQPSITETTSSDGKTVKAYPVFLYDRDTKVDMTYGRWNEEITTPDGKKFNLAYKIATADELATITFVEDGVTTPVTYVKGGTPISDTAPITGKVMKGVYSWDKAFATVVGDDTYTATTEYKPTISVFHNLSLYSNFKYNLYVPTTVDGEDIKNYITSVTLGNDTYLPADFEIATVGGNDYYVFTVENIDSNNTADVITFKVALKEGDNIAVGEKTLSVLGYLETALKGTNAEEKPIEYKLYQATLNYTKAAYAQFGGNATLVDALWNTYCKDFVDDAIDTATGTGTVNGLNTASLNLVAAPAFRFTAISTTADVFTPVENGHITVSYTYNGKTVTKSTSNGTLVFKSCGEGVDGAYKFYFDIELRAYEFYQDITVTVGETAGTYNLANYYNGLVEQSGLDEDLDALLKALNTYARAAAAYNK